MKEDKKDSHYTLLRLAKRGVLPDKRTQVRKSFDVFQNWLKKPYGENWNTLQEARWALAAPFVVFWLTCPVLEKDESGLNGAFLKASGHLERAIKDIVELADKAPSKVPNLKDYMKEIKANEHPQGS